MTDLLNKQIVERLRDAAVHAAEGGYEIDFAVVFVDCAKTILALIDVRDRLLAVARAAEAARNCEAFGRQNDGGVWDRLCDALDALETAR